ncbi:MAG: hypothetical protein ABMA00_00465 [Gemmatimonas sp.]
MSISRVGLVLITLLASACAAGDRGMVTGLDADAIAPGVRAHLQGFDHENSEPRDAWMGDSLRDVARVRVIDADGQPVSGVPVRFTVAARSGFIGAFDGSSRDTITVALSDEGGIASAGIWRLPTRDTIAALHVATAQLVSGDTAIVRIVVRAWRDLSRFGGDRALVIDRLPIERRWISAILPLGTFGTDDALPSADALLLTQTREPHAVRAIADGLITEIDARRGAITMRLRDHIRLRIGGVVLRGDLWVGRVLHAGDSLGAVDSSPTSDGVAVRVLDATTTRSRWVHPERYGARRNISFVVRYLADSVRSAAWALVRRAAPDLEGRIDYDRDGRLVGSWFDPSAPVITSRGSTAGQLANSQFGSTQAAEIDPTASLAPTAMTFAYDAERPGQVRIAVGSALASSLGTAGVRAVAWEDPDPADVGVARGLVRYHLYPSDDEERMGRASAVLLVQLVDATTLRVELAPATSHDAVGFSARAITVIR